MKKVKIKDLKALKDQFKAVTSVKASCRMNSAEAREYQCLNILFNELSGYNVTHSPCNKYSLFVKIQAFINEYDSKKTKRSEG